MRAHVEPIVPGARFSVRCMCGYADDSAANGDVDAIADVRTRHPHDDTSIIDGVVYLEPLTATAYPG